MENAESAGRSGERELVDRVRARGGQSVEAWVGKISLGSFERAHVETLMRVLW